MRVQMIPRLILIKRIWNRRKIKLFFILVVRLCLLFAYVYDKRKKRGRSTMSFNKPRIIPQTNDHHSAVLTVPQGKMHSMMPGLRVESARDASGGGGQQGDARPRFSKRKKSSNNPTHGLSPLTRTDRHYGDGENDFAQQQQPPKRSMLPQQRRGGGYAGKSSLSTASSSANTDPMEPSRRMTFSETDSSFSRLANPAKVAKKRKGDPKGVPQPPHAPSSSSSSKRRVSFAPENSSSSSDYHIDQAGVKERVRQRSEELQELEKDEMREREQLLYEFHRLEQEGVPMTKKFDRKSDLDAMRFEYHKLTSDQSIKSGVNSAKRTALLLVTGLEWMNGKYDPFGVKMKGFSDDFLGKWDEDYKPDVYRLYKMWNKRSSSNPYTSLIMTFVSQFVMFIISSSLRQPPKDKQHRSHQQHPQPQAMPYNWHQPPPPGYYYPYPQTQAQPAGPPPAVSPQHYAHQYTMGQASASQQHPQQQPQQQYQHPQPQQPQHTHNPSATAASTITIPPEATAAVPEVNVSSWQAPQQQNNWHPSQVSAEAVAQQQQASLQSWQIAQDKYGNAAPSTIPNNRRRAKIRPPREAEGMKSLMPLMKTLKDESNVQPPVTSLYDDLSQDQQSWPSKAPERLSQTDNNDNSDKENGKTIDIQEKGRRSTSTNKNSTAFAF